MIAAPAPARQPLTDVTWATLAADGAYLSADYAQQARLHWPALSDLGAELAQLWPHLGHTNPRRPGPADVLVDFTVAGLPVVLTWTNGEETTTAAVIVDHLGTRTLHVRYCGFAHMVNLADVTDARPFDTVRTWTV